MIPSLPPDDPLAVRLAIQRARLDMAQSLNATPKPPLENPWETIAHEREGPATRVSPFWRVLGWIAWFFGVLGLSWALYCRLCQS